MSAPSSCYLAIALQVSCHEQDYSCEIDNEIIELMAKIVTPEGQSTASFHALIQPKLEPELSEECIQHSGLSQQQIDDADTFPDVMQQLMHWLADYPVGGWMSWGKTDAVLLSADCARTDAPWPLPDDLAYLDARRWVMGNNGQMPSSNAPIQTRIDALVTLLPHMLAN
ncbi:exonuclease domain-containing protein [Plesiomonas shigelloides]|uniref:exonuclease domain-containing protein n=1 Tax=Plesiomonas shigelloides TaxID=703 RepID=UPI002887D155|nr:exonuclease domain-containing protein [Plesiomonas shigelloides]MDT1009956.1 exonuclease domain-containing protein [Plesiomonas shigelloides]